MSRPSITFKVFERVKNGARAERRFLHDQLRLGFGAVPEKWISALLAHGLPIDLVRAIVFNRKRRSKRVLVPVRCAEIIWAHLAARKGAAPWVEPEFGSLQRNTVARLAVEAWRATRHVLNITSATTGPIKLSTLIDQLGGTDAVISLMAKGTS